MKSIKLPLSPPSVLCKGSLSWPQSWQLQHFPRVRGPSVDVAIAISLRVKDPQCIHGFEDTSNGKQRSRLPAASESEQMS